MPLEPSLLPSFLGVCGLCSWYSLLLLDSLLDAMSRSKAKKLKTMLTLIIYLGLIIHLFY